MQEMWVWSLGQEDLLEKEMATHSGVLAWEILLTEGSRQATVHRLQSMKVKWKWKLLSCVRLFATPWTIQSMEFSRPAYWSGQSFPSPGDLLNSGIEPRSPALQVDSLPAEPPGKPKNTGVGSLKCRRPGFDSWVGKIPWRRKWQPTPVFLPGISQG